MKKIITALILIILSSLIFAQTPNKISYQAVIRNSSNKLIANQDIGMRISILQGSISGSSIYVETQTPTTNASGLATLEIGSGKTTEDFSTINWGNGPYYIKIETDPTGGTNYTISGTSQLLSVPYSFYAKTAECISANALPSITVQAPSDIQPYSINLHGIINGKGFSTDVAFEWGLTTSYGNIANATQSPITGNMDSPANINLTCLQSNTTYHYRIKAVNAVNKNYSSDMTFTTSLSAPQLTTSPVSYILAFSALTGGNITYDGGSTITSRGVCYSTNPNPTISNNVISSGSGTGVFSVNLISLNSGTKYYIRAYATNSVGTTYGNEINFTTQNGIIAITTSSVTNIANTTAISGGNISSDGGSPITARGICWSTNANPTIDLSTKTTDDVGLGSFTSNLTSLIIGTKYYVRAYATNSFGTMYGNEISFTVAAIGTIYEDGIVFYLDNSGQHGLVCARFDQRGVGNGIGWSNGTNTSTGATGIAIGTGKANTDAILNHLGAGSYAAQVCNDMEPHGTWYLPSKDELYLVYTVVKQNGYSTFGGYYWASTECSYSTAWEMTFSDGTGLATDKNDDTRLVRAIRAF